MKKILISLLSFIVTLSNAQTPPCNVIFNPINSGYFCSGTTSTINAFAGGSNFGTGLLGSLNVNSNTSVNTDGTLSAVSSSIGVSGSNSIGIANAANFSVGDEVLIITMQATTTPNNNVGNYEFKTITSITSNTLIFSQNLSYSYISSAAEKHQVIKVPQYSNVTVNNGGTLTCSAWNGTVGGVLCFRANGTVVVNAGGIITANGKGYRGVNQRSPICRMANGGQGEGLYGFGIASGACNGSNGTNGNWNNANGNGGGGGTGTGDSGGGGGGAYALSATSGVNWGGHNGGTGGTSVGNSSLTLLFMGGAGGEGGADEDGAAPGAGGNGGGIIYITANTLSVSSTGTISSNGNNGNNGTNTGGGSGCGMAGGGGGAGGSIFFGILNFNGSGTGIKADKGLGGTSNGCGGAGGDGTVGRIRFDFNGTIPVTTPTAYQGSGIISAGVSYTWSTGSNASSISVTPTITTVYNVTVSAMPQCSAATGSISITVNNLPTVTPNSGSLCTGQSFTLNGSGAQTYTWSGSGLNYNPPSGGVVTFSNGYVIHTFTSTGTFSVPNNISAEVLVVAGGGGGGMDMGGGGGGGGVIYNPTVSINSGSYNIVVGSGGWGAPAAGTLRGDGAGPQPGNHQYSVSATNGQNSSAFTFTAIGGGKGGSSFFAYTPDQGYGSNGGSGGGASGYSDGNTGRNGTGTLGQGNTGGGSGGQYYSGGGGGAGSAGSGSTNQANGGAGIQYPSISPWYFGGGGGGSGYSINGGNGGIGGGGGGAVGVTTGGVGINNGLPGGGGTTNTQCNTPGGNAGANTGGGGGGGSHYNSNNKGGNGGSGIVIIKYLAVNNTVVITPSATTVYTVVGTNSIGCISAPVTTTISVGPIPTLAVNNGTICLGQSFTIQPSGGASYTIQGGSAVVTPTVSSTYTIAGTSSLGCTSPSILTASVAVVSTPVISISSTTNALCSGQSINLSASGANTYTWSTGSNSTGISVSPTSNITYTLSGTNSFGCTGNTASLAVTVNTLPIVSISGTNALCSGQSINLSASGANTYTWSTNSNLSSISVAPTSNITYTLIGRSTAGCLSAAAASLAVTVNTLPVVSITGTNALCAGQTITLTANGANTYTWSNNSNAASIAVSPANNITYSLSGTSAAGCVGSSGATQAVTVYSLPVVSITGTNALCSGQTVTLTATFQGASSFTWNTGSNANNIAVSPTVNSTYTLNAQSAQGCSAPSASFAVTVNTLPIVNITGTNALCAGQTVTLTANGANTYTWSTNSNANSIGVTPTVSTTYSLNGRSAAGCSGNTATIAVTVYSLPTLSISGNAFICNGDAATLTVSGANTYTWNTNANTSSITVSPAANTTYTVNGTDNNGCNNTTVKTVTVNAIPQLSITGLSALCSGDSKTLTVSGSSTYTWSTGANATSVVVTPTLSAGMYTISVSGTSTAGCTGSKIDSLLVNAIPQLTISGGSYVCNGYTLNLNVNGANTYTWSTGSNSGSIAVTPSVNTTYSVSGTSTAGCIGSSVNNVTVISIPSIAVTGNTTICLGESTTLTVNGANTYTWSSGATGSLVVFSPTTSSNYTVIGEVGAGCSDTTQTGITVNPVPSLTLTPTSATICIGESLAIKADGAATYSWSNGLTTPTVVVSPTVTGTYSVTGTNTFNCNSSSNVQVTVLECTGLGKQAQGVVEVYPNPTEGILHIRGTEHANYIIMDMMGRVVEQGQGNVIDISRKARGMYMLQVTVEGRVVYQGRIVHN